MIFNNSYWISSRKWKKLSIIDNTWNLHANKLQSTSILLIMNIFLHIHQNQSMPPWKSKYISRNKHEKFHFFWNFKLQTLSRISGKVITKIYCISCSICWLGRQLQLVTVSCFKFKITQARCSGDHFYHHIFKTKILCYIISHELVFHKI